MNVETRAYINGYADCLARFIRAQQDASGAIRSSERTAFRRRNTYSVVDFEKAKVPESTLEILRPYFSDKFL